MKIIMAEWLLRKHREHLGLEKALKCRIRQLSETSDAEEVIASMGTHGCVLDGMPRTRSTMGKTERTTLFYEEMYQAEQREIEMCIQELRKELVKVQYYLQLYEAVIEGLTEREKWIINAYYNDDNSVDTMQRRLEEQKAYISKSSLRREKIRTVEKVQRIIDLIEQNLTLIEKSEQA